MFCPKRLIRQTRRALHPWIVLTLAAYQITSCKGVERDRARLRWMKTLLKIDAVNLISFLNDLLW